MKTSHQMEEVPVVKDRMSPLNFVFMIKYDQIKNTEIWGYSNDELVPFP